jgi:hypothetical protein
MGDASIYLSIYLSNMRMLACMNVINDHRTSVHHTERNKPDRYQLLATLAVFSRYYMYMYI